MTSPVFKRYGNGDLIPRIYLIAPRHEKSFWSMQGTVELLGAKTLIPNAALATLMALTPDDVNVEYVLCDENVSEIDWDLPCDLVAVTGSTLHITRIAELCNAFRQRGVPVALGGTYASINADKCRGLADYHFIGEAEYTWPRFLRQWTKGEAERVYVQETFVDLKDSPPPCDFCDVIQYMGRKYRIKSVDQVLEEIQNAHALGARTVFFSDDNFLGNKSYTKELLAKIIQWNVAQTQPLSFSTQITVEVGDDENLLQMFADACFSVLFLGVETVRKESLEEIHKKHNLKYDIQKRIKRISRYGIVPYIGLIVGFDNDDASVFDDLYNFLDETASPIAGISLLNAPRNTPLYERLKKEGRLLGGDFSGEWQLNTNIIPKQMTNGELIRRYHDLFQRIYDPELFNSRFKRWLEQVQYFNSIYTNKKKDRKQLLYFFKMLVFFLFQADSNVRSVFSHNIVFAWKTNPRLMRRAFTVLAQYKHFYYFLIELRALEQRNPG